MRDEQVFQSVALSQLPRILGFVNADETAATFGCGDRAFWHYKTSDWVNARFQEAALTVAAAFMLKDEENRFFQAEKLKGLQNAAVQFWLRCRHYDGSVDESYPQEHHFCATALSLFAVTESQLILRSVPSENFDKTARFLMKNNNADVVNQMAGAAVALYNVFLLTQNKTALAAAEDKLNNLIQRQAEAGYFPEYGGFDLGYTSITLSFLASLYRKTGWEVIKAAALRAVVFMQDKIDADGYYSPEGMSRHTQFLYPFGLAVFAPAFLKRLANGLKKNVVLNPMWMDDRYCIPLTNDYLLTALYLKGQLA